MTKQRRTKSRVSRRWQWVARNSSATGVMAQQKDKLSTRNSLHPTAMDSMASSVKKLQSERTSTTSRLVTSGSLSRANPSSLMPVHRWRLRTRRFLFKISSMQCKEIKAIKK